MDFSILYFYFSFLHQRLHYCHIIFYEPVTSFQSDVIVAYLHIYSISSCASGDLALDMFFNNLC